MKDDCIVKVFSDIFQINNGRKNRYLQNVVEIIFLGFYRIVVVFIKRKKKKLEI